MQYRIVSAISALRLRPVESNGRSIICALPEDACIQVAGPCTTFPGMLEVIYAGEAFAVFGQDLDLKAVREHDPVGVG